MLMGIMTLKIQVEADETAAQPPSDNKGITVVVTVLPTVVVTILPSV